MTDHSQTAMHYLTLMLPVWQAFILMSTTGAVKSTKGGSGGGTFGKNGWNTPDGYNSGGGTEQVKSNSCGVSGTVADMISKWKHGGPQYDIPLPNSFPKPSNGGWDAFPNTLWQGGFVTTAGYENIGIFSNNTAGRVWWDSFGKYKVTGLDTVNDFANKTWDVTWTKC